MLISIHSKEVDKITNQIPNDVSLNTTNDKDDDFDQALLINDHLVDQDKNAFQLYHLTQLIGQARAFRPNFGDA